MENSLGIPGRRFVYYQDAEDPMVLYLLLYLLGDWQFTDEHCNEFIPSPENQELRELLKHDLDISSIEMYHVDNPAVNVPTDANVNSIEWLNVHQDDKVEFEGRFSECRKWLDEYVRLDMKLAGGWRVEKAVGQLGRLYVVRWMGEYGWNHVENYSHIRDFVQEYDAKHGKHIDI